MTSLRELLAPLALAVATLVAAPLAGCAGTTTIVVREVASPPPNRIERAEYRTGFVFIQGHWVQQGPQRWAWSPGYYERERPGYVYIEGSWLGDEHGRHVWVDGEWRRRGGVVRR